MATSIGQLVVEFFANTARFTNDCDKARDKAKKTASDIHLSFSKIAEITLGVSFARGLEGLAVAARDTIKEMAKLGLEAKVQEDAFARLSESVGASGDALASALKAASGDIINTSDVMLAAARGLREGFAPEQLVRLMEVARQQSKLTGTEVTAAFNDITQAIANQQTRALKQYGIVIDVDNVTKAYAATLGVESDELNSVGKAQAIFNEVMAKTAASTKALTTAQLTQSEQLQRLSGQWKQLQEDIGKVLVDQGLAVLDWVQSLGKEVGDKLPEQLRTLQRIWTATWSSAVQQVQPVMSIVKDVLIPTLKVGAAVAASFGVGIAAAFSVVAGPIAYISSLLGDLSAKKMPDFTRATLEANAATANARVALAEAGAAFKQLQTGETEVTSATKATDKALGDLGKNTLGAIQTQAKLAGKEFESLARAMRALSERGATSTMSEAEAEIEQLSHGVREAAAGTKNLSADLRVYYEEWARGAARLIVANEAVKQLETSLTSASADARATGDATGGLAAKIGILEKALANAEVKLGASSTEANVFRQVLGELRTAMEGWEGIAPTATDTTPIIQDLLDETAAWQKVRQAMRETDATAQATGDTTGGLADKIKILEGGLAEAIVRFGSLSDEANAYRQELGDLRTDLESMQGLSFAAADSSQVIDRLLEEADLWRKLSDDIGKAQAEYLAVGDAVGAATAAMNLTAAAIADAIKKFGEGSAEVAALRARFLELRDAFNEAGFAESLRVVDNQAKALGLSFDSLGAKIQAYRATLLQMASDPNPNWAAIEGIRAQMEALENLKLATDLVAMAASRASDEFVEWAFTGKANFAEMAKSIIKDITKIILKMLVLKAIEMATRSFGFGVGVDTSSAAVGASQTGFARGGVGDFGSGTPAMLHGKEAIIPLDRWGEMGGDTNVTVVNEIHNHTDAKVTTQQQQMPDGRVINKIIIDTVTTGLGDGTFDPVMGATYGARRRGASR